MSVGVLFRKETVTAYRRIQDIHVSSNVIQRWLGISNISIQTASGSALPEIVIEGVTEPDKLRDWLYERLRGAKGERSVSLREDQTQALESDQSSGSGDDETTRLLTSIRDNLAELVRKQEAKS
jgi:putative membrane protein